MNRWARIVVSLSALATLVWIAGGLLGYSVKSDSSLATHTLVSYGALLSLLLCHTWVAVFVGESTRRFGRLGGLSLAWAAAARRARRTAWVAAAVAVLSGVAQFATSSLLYPSHLGAGWHALGGIASVITLGAALGFEVRALRQHGRCAEALELEGLQAS